MGTTEITVKDYNTYEEVTVTPMAVFGNGDFNTIFITDAAYRGLWLNGDLDWLIDVKEGDVYDAECIEGIFGADEDEWEASANKKLADYGFRLGPLDGNRYYLIAL